MLARAPQLLVYCRFISTRLPEVRKPVPRLPAPLLFSSGVTSLDSRDANPMPVPRPAAAFSRAFRALMRYMGDELLRDEPAAAPFPLTSGIGPSERVPMKLCGFCMVEN